MIVFLTGVSCAGKTTLAHAIGHHIEDALVRDIDEESVERPRAGHRDWLRWRAAEALYTATFLLNNGEDMFLSGIVWPADLVQSPAWHDALDHDVDVRFVYVATPWRVVKKRLNARLKDEDKKERRELIAYNRKLRDTLIDQTVAMRKGYVLHVNEGEKPRRLVTRLLQLLET